MDPELFYAFTLGVLASERVYGVDSKDPRRRQVFDLLFAVARGELTLVNSSADYLSERPPTDGEDAARTHMIIQQGVKIHRELAERIRQHLAQNK